MGQHVPDVLQHLPGLNRHVATADDLALEIEGRQALQVDDAAIALTAPMEKAPNGFQTVGGLKNRGMAAPPSGLPVEESDASCDHGDGRDLLEAERLVPEKVGRDDDDDVARRHAGISDRQRHPSERQRVADAGDAVAAEAGDGGEAEELLDDAAGVRPLFSRNWPPTPSRMPSPSSR